MIQRGQLALLVLGAAGLALALRVPGLNRRPMHGDEAVHAVKFDELWRTGRYVYDSNEYHGPTLYYCTFPSVWLSGAQDFGQTQAATYRIVPALFGVGVVLLTLLVADGLGRPATIVAACLAAVSPALVFYSRYYIQEMLLVFYTFAALAAGWRYARTRRARWAVLCGACLGLMHATKETALIALGCLAAALVATLVWQRHELGEPLKLRCHLRVGLLVAAAAIALAVSALLYSGFLTNLRGPWDSLSAYATYFDRAGSAHLHVHPWYYYLSTLLWTKYPGTPVWTEALILVLAVAGAVAACCRTGLDSASIPLARYVFLYAAFMMLAYSVIPYKTPWCLVQFLQPLTLLAGVGAVALHRWLQYALARRVAEVAIVIATLHLASQSVAANFRFYADQRNPYVYAHPLSGAADLGSWVERLTRVHPDGPHMQVNVIAPNPWPLPWYLRRCERVGYWEQPPADPDAPVVIVSDDLRATTVERLQRDYQPPSSYGLRPLEVLWVYVQRDLYEAFAAQEASRAGQSRPSPPP
jgi:uncharacterized protein (TIGR03663 family)